MSFVKLNAQQAYTVELEAELNQLREENAQLKHALVIIVVVIGINFNRISSYFCL